MQNEFCLFSYHQANRNTNLILTTTSLMLFSMFFWTITTSKLLGPITCLLHKDESIRLSALHEDTTSKIASYYSTLSFRC